jgi:hypothetical protein
VIVTTVLVETAAVVMLTVEVKLKAGTVVVAGTLATAGLLLESDTRAPPSGALVLSTTVLVDDVPPLTLVGFVSIVASVGGGGAGSGVKLKTPDHAPATPALFTPRTRQKCCVVARPLARKPALVTVASRSSGAVKADELSI